MNKAAQLLAILVAATAIPANLIKIAEWLKSFKRKKNTTAISDPNDVKKSRRSFSEWSVFLVDIGSLFAVGWLIILVLSTPESDPRWFTAFVALLVICALGRSRLPK